MHGTVLSDLELSQVEAERLRLPHQVLQFTESLPGGTERRELALHQVQISDELLWAWITKGGSWS